MGYTHGNQYIYFSVKLGEREIQSKAENWAEWVINVKAGDMFFTQQESSMGIILARNNLFPLDDVEEKRHVKTLKLGTILKSEK